MGRSKRDRRRSERFHRLHKKDREFDQTRGRRITKTYNNHDTKGVVLPDDVDFLEAVHIRAGEGKIRPGFIWGRYYDDDGFLKAVDCLYATTRFTGKSSDVIIDSALNRSLGNSVRRSKINITQAVYLPNDGRKIVKRNGTKLPFSLLPDILLRRSAAIVHNRGFQSLGLPKGRYAGQARLGVIFENCNPGVVNDDLFVPGVRTDDFEQIPLDFPEYGFTQDDIDDIFELANNYVEFCQERRFPVLWPEQGSYDNWPDEFLAFLEPVQTSMHLPWMGRDPLTNEFLVRYEDKGFSCDMSVYPPAPLEHGYNGFDPA